MFSTEIDGPAENFVVADNGDVYLQDAMATLRQGNWIKGHKAEGDTIVFNFPQKYFTQEATDDNGNPIGGMAKVKHGSKGILLTKEPRTSFLSLRQNHSCRANLL